MPYIDQKSRDRLNGSDPYANHARTVGELTYDLQQSLSRYIEDRWLSYQILAECLGALEGAKADLIERVVKPYEALKLAEKGDVWPESIINDIKPKPKQKPYWEVIRW